MLRKKILGLALGLSGFLFFYSSLFILIPFFPIIFLLSDGPSYMPYIVLFLIFLLLFIAIRSIKLGIRLVGTGILPELHWPQTILISILSIFLAIFLPYAMTLAELRWRSHTVPMYPNASNLHINVDPMISTVEYLFDTTDSEEDIMMFFITELKKKCQDYDWSRKYHVVNFTCSQDHITIAFNGRLQEQNDGVLRYTFNYSSIGLEENTTTNFNEQQKENKVVVHYKNYYFKFPNVQWFILFITITLFIYANIKIKRNDDNE